MDDGNHPEPTRDNMLGAYKKIIAESEAGDAIFLHYSGKKTQNEATAFKNPNHIHTTHFFDFFNHRTWYQNEG
jgi:hypothetical protein